MSEHVTPPRWPLILAIAALSALFAWVFLLSVERAKSERSTELTLEMGDVHPGSQNLRITPKLGTLPPHSTVSRRPLHPALWWPALLFGLAFLCGWLCRHGTRLKPSSDSATDTREDAGISQLEEVQEQVVDVATAKTPVSDEQPVAFKAIREPHTPDLDTDFPWDESVLDDTRGLTSEERIARLEKKNASKAEIIKALERLVTENREKWLHQDETEARLNNHIQTLSDDLSVAIRQLQRLQADSETGTHKNIL